MAALKYNHFSAGVGRTGTFMAIDSMLDMSEKENCVDIFGFVTRMRTCRPSMVQTLVSYLFYFIIHIDILRGMFSINLMPEYRNPTLSIDVLFVVVYLGGTHDTLHICIRLLETFVLMQSKSNHTDHFRINTYLSMTRFWKRSPVVLQK